MYIVFFPGGGRTLTTYQDFLPYSQDGGISFQIHTTAASYNFQALDCDVLGISQAQADEVKHFKVQGEGDCRTK